MTETQAKSGPAGDSANPVDQEAADGGAPPTGRAAVVGRATVPADAPSPKFTRAPGMSPPPDEPPATKTGDKPGKDGATTTGGGPISVANPATAAAAQAGATRASAKAPVSAPPGGVPVAAPGRPANAPASGGAPAGPPGARRPGTAGAGGTTTGPARGTGAVGAARVSEAVRAARSAGGSARGARRARLNLKRIDPWSVMKFSFAVSLVLFIVGIVATAVLYLALDAMGVFTSLNGMLSDALGATGGGSGSSFRITAKGVIGTSALLGAVNVVLFTALATLGAFIYNVCADLVGGVELTLAERD